jgi:transcriptional regulator with XRE-family HTH domain
MRGGDLVLMARRRAGLTQRELAEGVGCQQATIARWERGDREPAWEDVQAVAEACGLQVDVHLAGEDRGWWGQIAVQLGLAPVERVRRLRAPGGVDVVPVLESLASSGVPAIVIGEVAGALHGWPLALGGGVVEVCAPAAGDADASTTTGAAAAAGQTHEHPGDGSVLVTEIPPGTGGFGDLARDAEPIGISTAPRGKGARAAEPESIGVGGGTVLVASLLDLLRIADASPAGADGRRHAQAYGAVLDVLESAQHEEAQQEEA